MKVVGFLFSNNNYYEVFKNPKRKNSYLFSKLIEQDDLKKIKKVFNLRNCLLNGFSQYYGFTSKEVLKDFLKSGVKYFHMKG